jgi:c-di-GMP-binding flagellar brake protein YcgR
VVAARDRDGHIDLPRGLHLRVLLPGAPGGGATVNAVVRGIEADRVALGVLDLPDGAGRLVGEPVIILAQLHGRNYSMDSAVLAVEPSPPALIVSTPTEARRDERRRFYRLNTSIEARGSWTEREGVRGPRPVVHQMEAVRLLDIGGGGTLLRTRTWAPARTLLRLEFRLEGESTPVVVDARTIRVDEEPQTGAYRINTEFEGISRRTQEQIIRFIFRQQTLLSRRRNQ